MVCTLYHLFLAELWMVFGWYMYTVYRWIIDYIIIGPMVWISSPSLRFPSKSAPKMTLKTQISFWDSVPPARNYGMILKSPTWCLCFCALTFSDRAVSDFASNRGACCRWRVARKKRRSSWKRSTQVHPISSAVDSDRWLKVGVRYS